MRTDQPEGPTNTPVRLTKNRRIDVHPDWSPDGRRIAFDSGRDVFVMRADGSRPTNLTRHRRGRGSAHQPSWSPDGRRLVYVDQVDGHAPWNLYRMRRDGGGKVRLTTDAAVDEAPAWQPRPLQ